jgi:hypothetical protein
MDTLVELFKSADAKKAYEELLEELTAGFDRRLKTGETTSNTGAKSKSQAADDSEARARIVLQTYTPELMQADYREICAVCPDPSSWRQSERVERGTICPRDHVAR